IASDFSITYAVKKSMACSFAKLAPLVSYKYHHKPTQNSSAVITHTSDHIAASFMVTRCARPPLNNNKSTVSSPSTSAANTPHNPTLPTDSMLFTSYHAEKCAV